MCIRDRLIPVITNIRCNDNGTDDDPSDDYITFDIEVNGSGIGSNYFLRFPTEDSDLRPYGSVQSFRTANGTAGSGDIDVIIIDEDDNSCTFDFELFDPGTCSDNACNISDASLTTPVCNDNGTPGDPSDDYISFTLSPSVTNGSALGYGLSVSSGVLNQNTAEYGTISSFEIRNFSGNSITVTIMDRENQDCDLTLEIDNPCENCDIDITTFNIFSCNDNDTADPTDDFIQARILTSGTGSQAEVLINGVITDTLNIGVLRNASLPPGTAGGGDFWLIVRDIDNPDCRDSVFVQDPGSCSPECEITNAFFTTPMCNDNGTDDDPSDDFVTMQLRPIGRSLSDSFSVYLSGVYVSGPHAYSDITTINLPPGSADGVFRLYEVRDQVDPDCNLFVTVDVEPCSGDCNLTIEDFNVSCFDATRFNYKILVRIENGSDRFNIIGDDTQNNQLYNSFAGPFCCFDPSDPPLEIIVVDSQNASCRDTVLIDGSECICPPTRGILDTVTCQSPILINGEIFNGPDPINTEQRLLNGNAEGCDSIIDLTITFSTDFNPVIDTSICMGDSIELFGRIFNESRGTGNYRFPGTDCDTILNLTLNVNMPSEGFIDTILCENEFIEINGNRYDLNRTEGFEIVQSDGGCDSVINIMITPDPFMYKLQITNPLCEGAIGSATIVGNQPGFTVTFDGQSFESNVWNIVTLNDLNAGNYSISINTAECSYTESFTITDGTIEAFVSLGEDQRANIDEPIQLIALSNLEPDSIIWSPGDILSCTDCLDPVIIAAPGTYTITVTIIDANGCAATDEVMITIIPNRSIYIPNAMRLNSTLNAATLSVYGDTRFYSQVQLMQVFNRWGDLVYSDTDIPLNDPASGWDGRHGSGYVDSGVYVYYMTIEAVDGSLVTREGHITVFQ